MLKGGLNARLNALGVAPPKMEKGPKSAPKFFSGSFQFLAELRVLQPPLCIKKPLCEAVLRVLAGSCTQNPMPFHIFSFFMKTHTHRVAQGAERSTFLLYDLADIMALRFAGHVRNIPIELINKITSYSNIFTEYDCSPGDAVLVRITNYDYANKHVYGRIVLRL